MASDGGSGSLRSRELSHSQGASLSARRPGLVTKLTEVAGVQFVKGGDVRGRSLAREASERSDRLLRVTHSQP